MKTKKTTFKRLVSNLPYNPSLITQVAFYGKRLKQETSIRRIGFIFVGLTLFVQMFAVIAPPTPSLASSENDIINGGFKTKEQAILMCIDGNRDFASILAHYGVSCDAVAAASEEWIQSTNDGGKIMSLGRMQYNKAGEYQEVINGQPFYMRYLWSWDSGRPTTYQVLQGERANGAGTFYILFNCGNISIVDTPQPPVTPPPVTPPPAVPEKFADCSILLVNYPSGTSIKKGTEIVVRGQVTGGNLPAGTTANLTYEFVNANTGAPAAPPITAQGVGFENGTALDPFNRTFPTKAAGKYHLRLAATYDGGKEVRGSRQGNCISTIYVDQPDVCPEIPGDQTKESECKPCKDAPDNKPDSCMIWFKTARNDTQNIANADGTVAKAGDVITYTLSAKNTGKATIKKYVIIENITDILDYADVTDFHGGSIDKENNVRWPATDIKPGETLAKQLTIKVKNPIPQTPVSVSNPGKFDLTMNNVYKGTTVNIKLPPTVIKTTENLTTTLPNTGPGANMMIAFGLTSVVAFFFYRSRLLNKELNLVMQESTSGA